MRLSWFVGGAVAVLVVAGVSGMVFVKVFAHGFSAGTAPSALETFAAEEAREMALPEDARLKQNPVPASDAVLAEARAHWADHCATCHANDGSGQIPMGQKMYPPSPDMRKEGTQKKSDGELFYIIENGIRLSGMPAWGNSSGHSSAHSQLDSWKLVRFIRHLPNLSQAEIRQMEANNPKTPDDLEEEKQEEEFLKGGLPLEQHHHH